MTHGVAFVLVAGTVVMAEIVGHKLGTEGWLVIPLTLMTAGAGAAAVHLGRQTEHRRREHQEPTLLKPDDGSGPDTAELLRQLVEDEFPALSPMGESRTRATPGRRSS